MIFDESKLVMRFGEKFGFLFAYLIFTTILVFILNKLDKIPQSWNYLHIAAITLCIVFIGYIVKRLLK